MQVIYKARNWVPWKVLGTTPDYLHVRDWTDLEEASRSPPAMFMAPRASA
jgi:hypothetical protein